MFEWPSQRLTRTIANVGASVLLGDLVAFRPFAGMMLGQVCPSVAGTGPTLPNRAAAPLAFRENSSGLPLACPVWPAVCNHLKGIWLPLACLWDASNRSGSVIPPEHSTSPGPGADLTVIYAQSKGDDRWLNW